MAFRSLYLHFPFCETKCHYCDFYSIGAERTGAGDPDLFESALARELALRLPEIDAEIDTIFCGGGTPSMTRPDAMARAMAPLLEARGLAPGYEWTMEANPSSVTRANLEQYRRLGVNRVSMGVQALHDELLARLGRVHSRERALAALAEIFAAGIANVSVDLLCGVPGQTLTELERALAQLTRFPITHLSCYLLTLPKSHRMHRELPGEEEQLRHLLLIHDWMTSHGFRHYEISNFARAGEGGRDLRARHNLAYWQGQSVLACGPSGHSHDAGARKRWKNVSSLHAYARALLDERRLPVEWEESLGEEQLGIERWMLALRLDEGFPAAWLDTDRRRRVSAEYARAGFLETHPVESDRLRLTARGFAVSDQLVRGFL